MGKNKKARKKTLKNQRSTRNPLNDNWYSWFSNQSIQGLGIGAKAPLLILLYPIQKLWSRN